MLTFVTWKWTPAPGYRSAFTSDTVRVLRNMVARHYRQDHRFLCITDDPTGLDDIETLPLWDDCAAVPSAHGGHNPSCYRRLKAFAPEARDWFGDRFVSMDLDTVIVGDIAPLFDRDDNFVIWGCSDYPRQWFNGSLWMLRTGTHPEVWQTFDPATSPARAKKAGCFGSDQGWIRFVLGDTAATWGQADGVVSYRKHIAPNGGRLPADARIVCFHGHQDPWGAQAQQLPWVREHWC